MARGIAVCDSDGIHGEVVGQVRAAMIDDAEAYDLSDFFKVLGDSTRMRILCALSLHEMCVCDIGVLLCMTKSAISHQLRALKRANLVRFRRKGKVVYYALSDDHVRDILAKGLEHIREKE